MTSSTTTVDEYLDRLPDQAQTMARNVRSLIRRVAPDATEAFRYQMPVFLVGGQYLVYMGAWKNHLDLYPIPVLDDSLEARLPPHRTAKDTVRFLYRHPLPGDLVEDLARALVARLAERETIPTSKTLPPVAWRRDR